MDIKIISIHIPKTAGRSFYQVLKWFYGEKVDIPRNKDKHIKGGIFDPATIAPGMEVLHGHFAYNHIRHLHEQYGAKIITWLRDPVDRIISNYYYNIKMNQIKPWKSRSGIRTKMTLSDFARRPNQKNLMSRILEGISPGEIFFAGIVEQYEEHLRLLGKKLNWPHPIPEFHINQGSDNYNNTEAPTLYGNISSSMKEEIRQINREDLILYEKCRNLTNK